MPDRIRILFVCTGNTCRSPMAEAIARERLRSLGWSHVEVASAGTASFGASPASGGAMRAASRHGLDLSAHRSQPLTEDLVTGADLVLTMTGSHLSRALELGAGERAELLTAFAHGADGSSGPSPVPDPFGGPDEVYEETFELLRTLIDQALLRLEPPVAK